MSFSDLEQQRAVAEQLQRSLKNGRLAHAYLFVGGAGSGKRAMAKALAKALNCSKKEHDSCDACDSCRRIENDEHPDIYWLRPESKSRRIRVDQVREFESKANLRSSMGRMKVGVILDADCLTEEASNAFLKTLEEPPAQTIILLLSTQPQRLLPTILSRCLKISFGPVTDQDEAAWRGRLDPVLEEFAGNASSRTVKSYRLLAGITALLQQTRESIRQAAETEMEGYENLDVEALEELEEQMAARVEGEYRAERERLLEELYVWFADVLLAVEGADEKLLARPASGATTRRVAQGLNWEQASANVEAIEQIREALSRNINEPLALEVGLLKLATAEAR